MLQTTNNEKLLDLWVSKIKVSIHINLLQVCPAESTFVFAVEQQQQQQQQQQSLLVLTLAQK